MNKTICRRAININVKSLRGKLVYKSIFLLNFCLQIIRPPPPPPRSPRIIVDPPPSPPYSVSPRSHGPLGGEPNGVH